jgi:twinkle protein
MLGSYDVLSLPNATPSKQFWENAREKLANYEKIVISGDNDEAGKKVARKIYNLFPGKVYLMDHGEHKDANDFLRAHDHTAYRNAFHKSSKLKPDNILVTKDDFVNLFENTPDYEFFETGIPELDEKMLGLHKAAFTVILAETGIGKTEFFRYLEYQALKNTEYKIAFCHGEEVQLRSILGLFSYEVDKNLIRKDDVLAYGYKDKYFNWLESVTENERMYQFGIRVDEGVDEIVSQVRFLAEAMDVDFIFLEPIQDFVSATSTTEKESLLTDLTNKLKRLAPELNVGIVVIAHSNKDGEAKYAASIVQGAAYEIRLSRDVDAATPEERNRMYVNIGRKNRTGGGSGPAGILDFDPATFKLTPVDVVEPEASYTDEDTSIRY